VRTAYEQRANYARTTSANSPANYGTRPSDIEKKSYTPITDLELHLNAILASNWLVGCWSSQVSEEKKGGNWKHVAIWWCFLVVWLFG